MYGPVKSLVCGHAPFVMCEAWVEACLCSLVRRGGVGVWEDHRHILVCQTFSYKVIAAALVLECSNCGGESDVHVER